VDAIKDFAGMSMLGTLAKKPEAPKIPEAVAAPTPAPEGIKSRISAERALKRRYAKAGRAGTMLTGDESKLG